jgi:hypothetical protein
MNIVFETLTLFGAEEHLPTERHKKTHHNAHMLRFMPVKMQHKISSKQSNYQTFLMRTGITEINPFLQNKKELLRLQPFNGH